MPLVDPDENKIGVESDLGAQSSKINLKTPKRVLHFSDGVLEEYSTDEDEADNTQVAERVDTSKMTWGAWMWYKPWLAGHNTLSAVDFTGEYLASFFGITSPKYYFEIEEFKRKEAEKKVEEEQSKGWSQPATISGNVTNNKVRSDQPGGVTIDAEKVAS